MLHATRQQRTGDLSHDSCMVGWDVGERQLQLQLQVLHGAVRAQAQTATT